MEMNAAIPGHSLLPNRLAGKSKFLPAFQMHVMQRITSLHQRMIIRWCSNI